MAIVPKTISDKIAFYQSRQAQWTTNQTAIGLVAADTTALATKVTAAVDALADQTAAQQAAKDATTVLHAAARGLGDFGADLIKKIKAKAGTDGDGVYALASLPPPATPTPTPPPGMPEAFKVGLQPTGALELAWLCANPSGSQGTVYNVYRKIEDAPAFEYLGATGTKKFVDATLPAGSASVTYQIQAIRSTAAGVANELTVKFGVSSSGAMTAMIVDGGAGGAGGGQPKPAKIAA